MFFWPQVAATGEVLWRGKMRRWSAAMEKWLVRKEYMEQSGAILNIAVQIN